MLAQLVILCLAIGAQPDFPKPPPVIVDVMIIVNDAQGRPVPGAHVTYSPVGGSIRATRTDDAGVIEAKYNATSIGDSFSVQIGDTDQQGADWARLLRHSGFDPVYQAVLPAGADRYEITIDAHPTIVLAGRLTDELGNGAHASIHRFDAGNDAVPFESDSMTGEFEVVGVTRDDVAHFFCEFKDSTGRRAIWRDFCIGASHTHEDGDIGDVPLPLPIPDAIIRIDLASTSRPGGAPPMICLWHESGAFLINAETRLPDPSARESATEQNLLDIPIPSGTYYAFGRFTPNPSRVAILDALRAGRAHVLDELRVPRITVEPGDDKTITLDRSLRAWDRKAMADRLQLPPTLRSVTIPARAITSN